MREGLYFRDDGFAYVLLLVCALGARFTDDPRVLLEGYNTRHSAGWAYFQQAQSALEVVSYAPPRLYDLQIACVSGSKGYLNVDMFLIVVPAAYMLIPTWIVFATGVVAGNRPWTPTRTGTRST